MDDNLHDIEDLFFDALNDDEDNPSQNVWDRVERRLDKDNIVSIEKKYINLKRIAIFLLLLLGIAIYEIDRIYHSDSLTKNGLASNQHQPNSNGNVDETHKKKPGNISGTARESRNSDKATISNKQRGTLGNESQKLVDKEKEVNANNQFSQTAKTIITLNAQDNYPKKQALSTAPKGGRLTSKPLDIITIENATTAGHQQAMAQAKSDLAVYQIPFSENLGNTLIQNVIPASKNSIEVKKSMSLLLASVIKPFDTGANNVVRNKEKKTKRLSHFAMTPFFSPDIAWYHLQDDNINNQSGNAMDIEREEKHEVFSDIWCID